MTLKSLPLQILAREDESKKMIEINVSFVTFASSTEIAYITLPALVWHTPLVIVHHTYCILAIQCSVHR